MVPAHDEEELIGDCLAALDLAARRVAQPTTIVVVLDACGDATAAVVGLGAQVVTVHHRNVGAARAAGFAAVGAGRGAETWFATTDADSTVEPDWLIHQLRWAQTGAHMVVGTVAVADWDPYPDATRVRYLSGYHAVEEHAHVHGANLGVRADAYWAVGGFAPLSSGEDVDLVRRVAARDGRVVRTAGVPVRTSARAQGRAPAGFAAHLRALAGLAPASMGTPG